MSLKKTVSEDTLELGTEESRRLVGDPLSNTSLYCLSRTLAVSNIMLESGPEAKGNVITDKLCRKTILGTASSLHESKRSWYIKKKMTFVFIV